VYKRQPMPAWAGRTASPCLGCSPQPSRSGGVLQQASPAWRADHPLSFDPLSETIART